MSEMNDNRKSMMVTGLFNDRDSAERAYQSISDRGYTKDDVNLVMSDETRKRYFSGDHAIETELGSKAAEGAGIGAGIGGALGAIVAAVAAVGTSLVVPGLGLVIAGPIAAGLAGAGAGGVTGGLLGALIGSGIPEERVKHYEDGIRDGGILMGVTPRSEEDALHFEQHWKDARGEHVVGTGVGAAAGAVTGATIGSVAGPIGVAAGAAIGGITGGLAGKGAAEVVNPDAGDQLGDHNLAKGVGAGGGAMAGAAVGAIGGPVGMAAGAAIGAIAGGVAGRGVAAAVNPAVEDGHWREAYTTAPYYVAGRTYDDYGPAYALGYNGRSRYDGTFDGAEQNLSSDWETVRGQSRLTWQEATHATRAAWDRVDQSTTGNAERKIIIVNHLNQEN
jgi:hypothetical protein